MSYIERTPVQMLISPDNDTWQGRMVVLCDDGTIWESVGAQWKQGYDPIPGTRAELRDQPPPVFI